MKKLIYVLLFVFVLASCAPQDCSTERVEAGITAMTDVLSDFQKDVQIAGSMPRIALGPALQSLNEDRKALEDVEVPACLQPAKENLQTSFDRAITGFTDFLEEKSDTVVQKDFDTAGIYLDKYRSEIIRVRECAPDCEE